MKPGNGGRKSGQKLRWWLYEEKKSYTHNNLKPVTEVGHNNEPLMFTQIKDISIERNACA